MVFRAVTEGIGLSEVDVELLGLDGDTVRTGKRTMLNLLGRLSGIATHTRWGAEALQGTVAMVLDTRKTKPVAMIKDNHKLAAGSVSAAFGAVHLTYPTVDIQVEVTTTDEALEAVGARFLVCDNMSVDLLKSTIDSVRDTGEQIEIEATGGLTPAVARAYAQTGVDYLSVGGPTRSFPILDIALDLVQNGS